MAIDYYLRNTNTDATCDAGASVADYDLNKTQGSGPNTVASGPLTNTSYVEIFTWDIDVSGDSPATGSHTVKVNISAISKGNVRWRIQEVSSGCSVLNSSSYSTVYTSTGAKSDSLSLTWSTGDRLRLSMEFQFTGKGSGSVSISTEDASSVDQSPWSAGVALVEVVDETENISEGVITAMDLIRLINKTENISEGVITAMDLVRIKGTTLQKMFENISENVLYVKGIIKIVNQLSPDVENITEAIVTKLTAAGLDLVEFADEVEQITEVVLAVMELVRQRDSTENISETVLAVMDLVRLADEDEQISEGVITAMELVRLADETENISEGIVTKITSGGAALVEIIDEVENIVEGVIAVMNLARMVNETENISESIALAMAIGRILDEDVEISETVITPRDMVRGQAAEKVSIGESVIASLQVPIWSPIRFPTMLPQTGVVTPVFTSPAAPGTSYTPGASPVIPSYSGLTGNPLGESWSRVYPFKVARTRFDEDGETIDDTFDTYNYAEVLVPPGDIEYYSEPKVMRLRGWSSLGGPGTLIVYYTSNAGVTFEVVSPIKVHYRFKWAAKYHFQFARLEIICPDPDQGYLTPVVPVTILSMSEESTVMTQENGEFVLPDSFQDRRGQYRIQFLNNPPVGGGQASMFYVDDVDIFLTAAVKYSGHPV